MLAPITYVNKETPTTNHFLENCGCLKGNALWDDKFLREYVDHLHGFILDRTWRARETLRKGVPEELLKNSSIIMVGSDARYENAPGSIKLSPLQFAVIGEHEKLETIARFIKDAIARSAHLPFTESICELITYPGNDPHKPISGFRGDANHSWPDRILDATFLMGNEGLLVTAGQEIFQEWHAKMPIRESVKGYLRAFLNITQKGGRTREDQEIQHYNFDTGVINFAPEAGVRGLKYGPLRALQVFLTFKRLSEGETFGLYLPSSTVEKLKIFYPDRPDVQKAYIQALALYHKQQELRAAGLNGGIQTDPNLLKSICDTIGTFIKEERPKVPTQASKKAS